MGLVVNHNIPALQTYNAVNATTNSLQKSIQKLSTGLRINSAADDAAGLAISEKMRAQIRGLDRAVSNSQDGISMLQTAEGALSETHSILQRMRELSVQAANDTLTQQDRSYIQLEIDQLREEVTRIGNTTQFNKKKLLDGSAAVLWSSDKLSTKAIVNGGLRATDAFGQKNAVEGNFVIDVNATPGKAQVQKSDVFTIKHADVVMGVSTNSEAGINGVSVNNLPAGDYQITMGEIDPYYNVRFKAKESSTARYLADNLKLDFRNTTTAAVSDGSVTLDAAAINETAGTVTLTVSGGAGTGTLVFNIADGSLADGSGFAPAGGFAVGDTKFSGKIDVEKLRQAATPATATNGTTLDFTVAAGTVTYTPGTAKAHSATASAWAGFGVTTGKPNAAAGEGALADLMAKAGVNSYSVKIVAGGASGATSTASLVIDGKVVQTATVNAGTDSNITFANVVGSNSVVLAYTKATTPANLTAGDTWENTFTVAGLGTAAKGDTLTVSDYRNGMIFKPASNITSAHNVTLRASDVTATAGSESIKFDVFVDGAQSTASWTVDRTLKDFTITVGGEALKFKAALGSLDVAKAKKGDEVVYSTVQDAKLVGRYGTKDAVFVDTGKAKSNASVLMEVTSVSDVNESVDFKVTANILNTDGSTTTRVTNLTLNKNDLKLNSIEGDAMNLLGLDLTLSLDLNLSNSEKVSSHYKTGDKLVYNVLPLDAPSGSAVSSVFKVDGQQNAKWGANWIYTDPNDIDPATNLPRVHDDMTIEGTSLLYGVNAKAVNGQDVHLKNFYVNEKDGTVYTGDIVLTLDKEFDTKIKNAQSKDVLASFEAAYVGQVAKGDVKLRDLDKFWNSEGRFLLNDPQTLTITQGDGTRASVTLYATDTLNDAATKLNEAIAKQLGQQSVLHITDGTEDPAAKRFVTFVDDAKEGTSEALAGTFVIRSVVAGGNGDISFAGDEELVNKFSLNEIQASEENSFTASVWDAHSGKSVASSVKITGNKLIGVVNENVDVVFDPMANVKVEWNEATKSFSLTKDEGSYQTILHLADNTTVFQIGANEGEDMGVNFGDMRAEALGLNAVLVTDRESAARSITIIDNAIDKVSMQRAKIGAYQNRLEHTINNLTVAGENLTAAESRIRDTDMAKEMMNFTKLQIMLQAGTSMLAQANQLPQNVLGLLR